jgi:hypothetical protein
MSGRSTHYSDSQHKSPGVRRVAGTFVTADTAAPTTKYGTGFTVSAPSTGVYTITSSAGETYLGYIAFGCDLMGSTGSNDVALFTAITPTTSGGWTATIETQSAAGTAANLNGPTVSFWIEFRDTNVTK